MSSEIESVWLSAILLVLASAAGVAIAVMVGGNDVAAAVDLLRGGAR